MRIKFNKFERIAGLFVLMAIAGSFAATLGVAIKKGWFSSKIEFTTTLESADGLHAGTVVQLAGLRAGSVDDVELLSGEEVRVRFKVLEKFHNRIRKDSRIQVIRPFIIGEKVLEISIGSEEQEEIPKGGEIASKASFDIMDIVSGRRLGPFLGTLESLMENLKILADAFADRKRTEAFVQMFDRLSPLVKNMNQMSREVTKTTRSLNKKQRLNTIAHNLASLTTEMNKVLPAMMEEAPAMAHDIPKLVNNLTVLTGELNKLTPAINALAPDLPQTSLRAVEALNEAVVLLKAMQKNFFLNGSVEEVREEEAKRNKQRLPAQQKDN